VDPVPDAPTSAQPDVRLAKHVIEALRELPRGHADAVAGAIRRIGKEPETPLDPQRPGEGGKQYLVVVPTDDSGAPVMIYRKLQPGEGRGYLVTGLGDRETFGALERTWPGVFANLGGVTVGQVQHPWQPAVTIQPVRLAPRPVSLAGREELLAELDARLSAGDVSSLPIVVLCGLGGVGTTSLAVEYAYRHLAEVGMAWQFQAQTPETLTAGFGELAAELGTQDLPDAPDPVELVHGILAAYPAEWLLIFDNALDYPSVQAFLPPAGPGRIVITSQNPNWPYT
jgi:hypothetical protein